MMPISTEHQRKLVHPKFDVMESPGGKPELWYGGDLTGYRRRFSSIFARLFSENHTASRVEEAWLIHRESGLMLCHAAAGTRLTGDPSLMSGMMQAMESLVTGAFDDRTEGIQHMRCGDRTLVFDRGQLAIIALIVRGEITSPTGLGTTEILRKVHSEFEQELIAFTGDRGPFESSKSMLTPLIRLRPKKASVIRPLLIWGCVVACLSIVVFKLPWKSAQTRQWNAFVEHLRHEPGYKIVFVQRDDDGTYIIAGSQDPLARPFREIRDQYNLYEIAVSPCLKSEPCYDPVLVEKRVTAYLRPPATVTMQVVGTVVKLAGRADEDWVRHSQLKLRSWDRKISVDFGRLQVNRAQFRHNAIATQVP